MSRADVVRAIHDYLDIRGQFGDATWAEIDAHAPAVIDTVDQADKLIDVVKAELDIKNFDLG